jgi:hypothetical protein
LRTDGIMSSGKNMVDETLRGHDPEKWNPVCTRDKRQRRLRGDHARKKERRRV